MTFFDRDWKVMPFERHYSRSERPIAKPYNYEKMIELAEILSQDIPFVRVDFYESNAKIVFGELTVYPYKESEVIKPEEWGKRIDDLAKHLNCNGGGYTIIENTIVFINYAYLPYETDLRDYKFYCFNGNPEYCQVIADRSKNETIDFYDKDWNHQEFTGLALPNNPYPFSKREIRKPITFEKMKEAAAVLSKGIPFLRVDFYEVNGNMYFGELTFYPASGFGLFSPEKWNIAIGEKLPMI